MRTRGFTLIELLVALAIMAIISAVAVPIYTEYSVRTQRTNAEKDLMLCAQSMERLASADLHLCRPHWRWRYRRSHRKCLRTVYDDVLDRRDGRRMRTRSRFARRRRRVRSWATALLEVDASGAQRWDRNNDGDFGDANETAWGH